MEELNCPLSIYFDPIRGCKLLSLFFSSFFLISSCRANCFVLLGSENFAFQTDIYLYLGLPGKLCTFEFDKTEDFFRAVFGK